MIRNPLRMKNKSKAYWQKRFLAVEQRTHDAAVDYLQDLAKAYEQADAYLRRDIELWYARFAANNEVSLAEAKKLLDRDELKEFKWTVEEYIEKGKTLEYSKQWAKELENASAKVHINRAEALRIQLRQRAAEIYAKIDQEMPILMQAQYKDAYLGTAFEVAQGSGAEVTIDLARIDDAALAKVIKKPWSMDGKTFSSRIWTNQAQLIVNLQKSLMTSFITGSNKDDMIRRIAKDFKTDLYKAARLVHTESAAMAAMADKDMYEDLGTEEFEVLETLDMKTCEVCGDMDGKHFPLKDYEIGVTVPPFHPNCRGTTVPYIDEEELAEIEDDEPYPWGTRAARDPKTGKTIQVPGNMTYKEWRESLSNSKDIQILRSVGAAAFRDSVKLPDGSFSRLKEGSKITKVFVFAGKGTNKPIKVAHYLEKQYGVPQNEWKKVRGKGIIMANGQERTAELHWFESDQTGRIKMKVKRYYDED